MANKPIGGRRRAHVVDVRTLTDDQRRIWRDLTLQSPDASPFLGPAFAEAAAMSLAVFAAFVFEDNRVVAVFPFQFPDAFHRLLGAAERVGGELSDRAGIVAVPDFRITAPELLTLARLRSFLFTHLSQGEIDRGLTGEKPEIGLVIDFAEGAEAFWAERRRSDVRFVRDTERRKRRLEADLGPIRFVPHAVDPSAALQSLIKAKRAQYRRTGVGDPFDIHWANSLLQALSGCVQPECTAVLSSLYAGDTWIASHFGLRCRDTLHYWFPVYNPEAHKVAPGRLLLAATIDAAAVLGIRRIDRGQGDSPSKRDFATGEQRFWRGLWYRPGIRSFCYRVERGLRWKLEARRRRPASAVEAPTTEG